MARFTPLRSFQVMMLCALLALTGITDNAAAQPVYVQEPPFNSCILTAQLEAPGRSFQYIIYVDNYGEQIAAQINGSEHGDEINRRIVFKDEFKFFFEIDKKHVRQKPALPTRNTQFLFDSTMVVGKEPILGYECQVMKSSAHGFKAWYYETLLLKLEYGQLTYEVTSIDDSSVLPANAFIIPDDYTREVINYNFDR